MRLKTLVLYSIPGRVNMRQIVIQWKCVGWINMAQRTVLLWTLKSRLINVGIFEAGRKFLE